MSLLLVGKAVVKRCLHVLVYAFSVKLLNCKSGTDSIGKKL